MTAVDPAEQARIDQGKKLIKDANDAIAEKNYDKARKLLAQATKLGNESQRFEIEEAQDKLDKRQAKLWANEVDDSFKNKDCAGAFKQLAQPLKQLGRQRGVRPRAPAPGGQGRAQVRLGRGRPEGRRAGDFAGARSRRRRRTR